MVLKQKSKVLAVADAASVAQDNEYTAANNTFLNVLETLRKVDSEFPLQYSICLAQISMQEGMSLTELANKMDLGLSTVSRIVGALSKYRQNGNPYGLIELKISPEERRKKAIFLTDKGRDVLAQIYKALESNAN